VQDVSQTTSDRHVHWLGHVATQITLDTCFVVHHQEALHKTQARVAVAKDELQAHQCNAI